MQMHTDMREEICRVLGHHAHHSWPTVVQDLINETLHRLTRRDYDWRTKV